MSQLVNLVVVLAAAHGLHNSVSQTVVLYNQLQSDFWQAKALLCTLAVVQQWGQRETWVDHRCACLLMPAVLLCLQFLLAVCWRVLQVNTLVG